MSVLTRAIAIRPGEERMVLLMAGTFAAVEAGRGLGEVGVDTLVVAGFGTDVLPRLYIGLGAVGLVVTLGYGAALARSSSRWFFPALLVVLATLLGAGWLVADSGEESIVSLVWISVYAAGLLLLTVIWTVGSFAFDARQAKRLFPLLTSAAVVGSLAGSLSAIVVQRMAGTEVLILLEAGLFLVAAGLLTGLGARARPRRAVGAPVPSVGAALTSGASYVASSPLMRLVAIAYVLLAILMFSLTFPFMTKMREAYSDEQVLLTVLAAFSAAVTAVSFLIGTLIANRLYARLGVATVALVLPTMYLLGFGLWMANFTVRTAVVVRFAQQVTQRGLSNAAFSAFYGVVPSARRGQVMAFMDGVPGQLGTMISGVLILIASSLAMTQVFQMGLVTAVACVVVMVLVRRAYAGSLVATLRIGRAEQVLEGGPGLEALGRDARVIAGLRTATRAASPQERLLAADLLGRLGASEAGSDLRALWADEDAGVRHAAITAAALVGDATFDDLVSMARDDGDERARAAAVTAIGRLTSLTETQVDQLEGLPTDGSGTIACEIAVALGQHGATARAQALIDRLVASRQDSDRVAGLDAMSRVDAVDAAAALEHFEDRAPGARVAAIRAAARHDMGDLGPYLARLDDPSREVRTTAAIAIQDLRRAGPALIDMLNDGSERVQEAALVGLDGHAPFVRERLLEWSQLQVARATALRRHAVVLSAADETTSAAFLGAVIAKRVTAIESKLLQALATLGAPEASGLIRRCLHAPDPEVRAQAIEALDALGDPGLARGVVRLLDREADGAVASDADVTLAATALADDPDPWVRTLALRTLSERLRAGRRDLAMRVREDPDPLIRETVEVGEEDEAMADTIQLVSEVDRMLALRRVPLFEALGPEDLQRVASSATEQSWAEGDELMREGDLGDELVVIVEGSVRVVHRDEDVEHEVRTYGEGDHIGELAVLREAPRAATVVAQAPGVRGLVISGEAVGALLRERPDAAMAMLTTLAERISQQA